MWGANKLYYGDMEVVNLFVSKAERKKFRTLPSRRWLSLETGWKGRLLGEVGWGYYL